MISLALLKNYFILHSEIINSARAALLAFAFKWSYLTLRRSISSHLEQTSSKWKIKICIRIIYEKLVVGSLLFLRDALVRM